MSVYNIWDRFFSGVFLNQNGLSLSHSFVYMLILSIYSVVQPVCHRLTSFFFKPESIYAIMTWHYLIRHFLECCSERFMAFLSLYNSFFFVLFIYSPFLLCSFPSHIFLPNRFASFVSSYWFVLVHSPPTCW